MGERHRPSDDGGQRCTELTVQVVGRLAPAEYGATLEICGGCQTPQLESARSRFRIFYGSDPALPENAVFRVDEPIGSTLESLATPP